MNDDHVCRIPVLKQTIRDYLTFCFDRSRFSSRPDTPTNITPLLLICISNRRSPQRPRIILLVSSPLPNRHHQWPSSSIPMSSTRNYHLSSSTLHNICRRRVFINFIFLQVTAVTRRPNCGIDSESSARDSPPFFMHQSTSPSTSPQYQDHPKSDTVFQILNPLYTPITYIFSSPILSIFGVSDMRLIDTLANSGIPYPH